MHGNRPNTFLMGQRVNSHFVYFSRGSVLYFLFLFWYTILSIDLKGRRGKLRGRECYVVLT